MRIKSDVEFVKKECMSDDTIDWCSSMKCRCGEKVTDVKTINDTKVKCTFSDGDWYYYTPDCLEESVILEKGKKYTVNGSNASFAFIEESENFAIFEGGIVFKKEGNTFTEYDPKPEFVKKEWNVEINSASVIVKCDGFSVAMFTRDGCNMIGSLPKSLGFTLDEDCAVKVVK